MKDRQSCTHFLLLRWENKYIFFEEKDFIKYVKFVCVWKSIEMKVSHVYFDISMEIHIEF